MRNQPNFSAMCFSIANFNISCALEGPLLKITLASLKNIPARQIAIASLTSTDSTLELSFSLPPPSTATYQSNSSFYNNSSRSQQLSNVRLDEKLSLLEQTVKDLESKLLIKSQSKRSLRKNASSEGRFSGNSSRKNLVVLPSTTLQETEEILYSEIIEKEVEQNAKLELLNDLLQEKILQKEGVIVELEKQLTDREELIRELAEKLITANMEREEIFSEYQKILQSTVFHRMEDNTPKASKYASEEQKEAATVTSSELDVKSISPPQEIQGEQNSSQPGQLQG